jgi:hypothetical protein
MLIAIAIALSISIAANLHVDAALSYLKASRVCGDGPSKQWRRRRKNRCGRHEKYDCLHVGSPFRKSPNDLTLTNPESSVHHGRPRRLLSTEVGSWSKTRKGKKVEAKNSFQACQVTGTTAQLPLSVKKVTRAEPRVPVRVLPFADPREWGSNAENIAAALSRE